MNNTVNKLELIDRVTFKTLNVQPKDVKRIFDAIFSEITLALQAGDVVSLPKFGTFRVIDIAERPGMNPRTKETITIPAHKRAKFSAGTVLRAAVNGGNNHGDN